MAPNVVFVVYPGVKLLDLAGPLQVFSDARTPEGAPAYQTAILSMSGGEQATDTPVSISSSAAVEWRSKKIDTLLIVGGDAVYDQLPSRTFIDLIKSLAGKSRRVAAICSGAFVLAEAGLLDGRAAVTHWESCERLKQNYPQIDVLPDAIYLNDGKYWTSAGVTAGIDMAIQLVAHDLGKAVGVSIAKSLVTYVVRPGGQSQFSQALALQSSDSAGRFDALHEWMQSHLHLDLANSVLASYMCMSPRTFARQYVSETGLTPAKAVESLRVEAACRLLTQSDRSIAEVARRCGFVDDERMRRAFMRTLKTLPQEYRSRFS